MHPHWSVQVAIYVRTKRNDSSLAIDVISILFSVDARLHTLSASSLDSYCFRHFWVCGLSTVTVRIICGCSANYPCRSAQLSAAVCADQSRNSSEKVKFSVSHTVLIIFSQILRFAVTKLDTSLQIFLQSVCTQSADWPWERIAEHFPCITASCKQGVRAFVPLAIYDYRTYIEGIHIQYLFILDAAHRRKKHSLCQTRLSEGCVRTYAMRTIAECCISVPYSPAADPSIVGTYINV